MSRSNRLASSGSGSNSAGSPATRGPALPIASRVNDVPRFGFGISLHQPPLRPDQEVVQVHRRHFAMKRLGRACRGRPLRRSPGRRREPGRFRWRREPRPARHGDPIPRPVPGGVTNSRLPSDSPTEPSVSLRVQAEELQVAAVVEDDGSTSCPPLARTGPGRGACHGRASARTWSWSGPA